MTLETLHLVLTAFVGASLVGLIAVGLLAYPRSVRRARARLAAAAPQTARPAPTRTTPVASMIAPAAPRPAPARRAPDLKKGLRRSRGAFVGRLEELLRGRPALDPETLYEIESLLFGVTMEAPGESKLVTVDLVS